MPIQDLVPPFRALAEVRWHQPLQRAGGSSHHHHSSEPPASVNATVRVGALRAQPAFGDVPLLQGVMRDVVASLAAQEQVGAAHITLVECMIAQTHAACEVD